MNLIDRITRFHAEIQQIRRDLHAHPELRDEEHRTSDAVARSLAAWGIETHRGLGGTGVVGVIRNGTSARSVGLRADMDALPNDAIGQPGETVVTPRLMSFYRGCFAAP